MITVGLCGGIGAGKSVAEAAFVASGIPTVDADCIYHEMIASPSPLTALLAERFGSRILASDGGVNRASLAELVFTGADAEGLRAELNRITHGAVLAECRRWLDERRKEGAAAAIVSAPLLFESGFAAECDIRIAVLAPEEARLARIMARDGSSRAAAERRMAAQHDDAFLLANTEYQLRNDGTVSDLEDRVRDLSRIILKIAEEKKHG